MFNAAHRILRNRDALRDPYEHQSDTEGGQLFKEPNIALPLGQTLREDHGTGSAKPERLLKEHEKALDEWENFL